MGDVIKILQDRKFTLEEARQLLPLLKKITKESLEQFLLLEEKLKSLPSEDPKSKETETQIGEVLNRWGEKVMKLGALPKGIWLVDFDNGEGYYCWRYGDDSIEHFHGYREGFAGRLPIQ